MSSSGMTTGDDGSGEGLAIGQLRTRMRPSRLMVGGEITKRLMVVVSPLWSTVVDSERESAIARGSAHTQLAR